MWTARRACRTAIWPFWRMRAARLSAARQAVLVNMAFQLGTKGLLAFRVTLGSIEDGQYSEAALGMLDSTWAKQTPARAMRLATQMETGEWV